MQALHWLVGIQTSQHGQLRPIGSNGFYQRDGARADFDQQPIEAQTTVSACLEAYSCGSLAHGRQLVIPYGISDYAMTFATLPLDQVLAAME
jgi:hypothetical protein